jgi:outer membrane protein assembly factor BamB
MYSGVLKIAATVILLTVLPFFLMSEKSAPSVNWPSFRGPNASGIAQGFTPPITWSVEESKNILWKTPIPGLGLSSPIVWGDRLFVSTAIGEKRNQEIKPGLYGNIESVQDDTVHRWIVYCLDKKSGKILWERTACSGVPKVKRHPKSTHANSTLATDGKHVVAFFGSEGLYCYDLEGKLLWSKSFGLLDSGFFVAPSAQWEFGSSPIIYKSRVIVLCDVLKNSFIAALDINDGHEVWRTARDDVPAWSTPAIYDSGGSAQIIVNGFRHIGGYDAETGRELWRLDGGGDIPVPTPVISGDIAIITGAHGSVAPIYAVKLSARGDISLHGNQTSNDHILWSWNRDGSYMATPLVYGGHVYNCRWNGVLCCYEIRTGKRLYQERLGGGTSAFTSSPVAADGKIYITSEDGDVYVVKAGAQYELLARNSLDGICLATPAISEGTLFFRTKSRLMAISGNAGTKVY